MTIKRFFGWVVLTSAVLFLLSSCASLKPIEYRGIENFSVQDITTAPKVSVEIKFYNPNKVGAKLKDLNLLVLLNNSPFTTLQLDDVAHAGSQREFGIPLSAATSLEFWTKLLPQNIEALANGKDLPVEIIGSVTVKKFIFRKTFEFAFKENINTKTIKTPF